MCGDLISIKEKPSYLEWLPFVWEVIFCPCRPHAQDLLPRFQHLAWLRTPPFPQILHTFEHLPSLTTSTCPILLLSGASESPRSKYKYIFGIFSLCIVDFIFFVSKKYKSPFKEQNFYSYWNGSIWRTEYLEYYVNLRSEGIFQKKCTGKKLESKTIIFLKNSFSEYIFCEFFSEIFLQILYWNGSIWRTEYL